MASSKGLPKNSSLADRTLVVLRDLGLKQNDALLVAVSGGIDSVSLFDVLVHLRDNSGIGSLSAVHVNHQLRAEASEADERLVRRICEERFISLECKRVDTARFARDQKLGLEEAARELRYRSLSEIAAELGVPYVATAHTANDQAETVLMNLVRGAGARGLSGIPRVRAIDRRSAILRPWLSLSRNEIEQYAKDRNLHYSEDATNAELTFQRNRVRHVVLPAMHQAFADRDVIVALCRLAERMSGIAEYVAHAAELEFEKRRRGKDLDGRGLEQLPSEIAEEVIQLWIEHERGRYRLSAEQRERILEIIAARDGRLQLPGIAIAYHQGRLVVQEPSAGTNSDEPLGPAKVSIGDTRVYGAGRLIVSEAVSIVLGANRLYVDAGSLGDLRIRSWQDRDRIQPFGMAGQSKLVSDLLTDARISGPLREQYPVVEDVARGEIIWVPGVRAAESTRRDSNDGLDRVVQLEWHSKHEE